MNPTLRGQAVLDEIDRNPGDVLMTVRDALEAAFEEGAEAERSRIRRELLEAIEAAASVVQLSEGEEDAGEPVEMVEKEAMLDALDRICPEEG